MVDQDPGVRKAKRSKVRYPRESLPETGGPVQAEQRRNASLRPGQLPPAVLNAEGRSQSGGSPIGGASSGRQGVHARPPGWKQARTAEAFNKARPQLVEIYTANSLLWAQTCLERLERRIADVQEMAAAQVSAAAAELAGMHGTGLWQEQSVRYFSSLGCGNLKLPVYKCAGGGAVYADAYAACCISATPTINSTWVDMDLYKHFEMLHWKYGVSANGAPVAALLCCFTRSAREPASAAPHPHLTNVSAPFWCSAEHHPAARGQLARPGGHAAGRRRRGALPPQPEARPHHGVCIRVPQGSGASLGPHPAGCGRLRA
jgi:hypothetical protein